MNRSSRTGRIVISVRQADIGLRPEAPLPVIQEHPMKLKLASLGLLALAPLAAQAELVEMQDTEMAGVAGQGFTFNFNATFDESIFGLDVYKNVYAYKLGATDWELGQDTEVSNPVADGRYFSRTTSIGNDGGEKYVYRYRAWGRN
jgi:hypothetical protein